MAENEINAHSFNTQYSEFFGQWPWKKPQGENQSERERFLLFLQGKIQTVITVTIQLISTNANNPAGCLVFCA